MAQADSCALCGESGPLVKHRYGTARPDKTVRDGSRFAFVRVCKPCERELSGG